MDLLRYRLPVPYLPVTMTMTYRLRVEYLHRARTFVRRVNVTSPHLALDRRYMYRSSILVL